MITDRINQDLTLWRDPHTRPRETQQRLVARGWPIAVDGVIGPKTRAALAEALACHDGVVENHPTRPRYITHDGTRKVRSIILHWPGGHNDAAYLGDYWTREQADPKRRASSHYGIDEWQTVRYCHESAWRAWHAPGNNTNTIGIDICQPPLASQIAKANNRGLRVSRNGDYLTIDPRICERTRAVVGRLCNVHGIPAQAPPWDGTRRTAAQWHALGFGVLAHAQVQANRADPLAWWGALWA